MEAEHLDLDRRTIVKRSEDEACHCREWKELLGAVKYDDVCVDGGRARARERESESERARERERLDLRGKVGSYGERGGERVLFADTFYFWLINGLINLAPYILYIMNIN